MNKEELDELQASVLQEAYRKEQEIQRLQFEVLELYLMASPSGHVAYGGHDTCDDVRGIALAQGRPGALGAPLEGR